MGMEKSMVAKPDFLSVYLCCRRKAKIPLDHCHGFKEKRLISIHSYKYRVHP